MIRKYERLDILHENTLKPRTHYISYDTPEKALAAIKELAKGLTSNIYLKTLWQGQNIR